MTTAATTVVTRTNDGPRPDARALVPRLAWASIVLALVGAAALAAALVVAIKGALPLWFIGTSVLTTGTWLGAGVVCAWRKERDAVAALVIFGALAAAVGLFARVTAAAGHATGMWLALQRVGIAADCLGSGLLFHLVLSLPDGRLGSTIRRAGVTFGYVIAVGMCVLLEVNYPGGPGHWERFLPAVTVALGVVFGGWAVHSRYLGASRLQRRRIQWFCGFGGIGLIGCILVIVANLLFEWPRPVGALEVAATALLPLALATDRTELATVRSERLSILVFRALVWVAFVSSLLIVFVLGLVHRPRAGQRGLVAATIVALLVAAAAVPIVGPWLTELADRVVHGDRHPSDDALRVLSRRLSRAVPLDDLLRDVVDALTSSQGSAGVELWQHAGGDVFECSAANPPGARSTLTVLEAARVALLGRGVAGPEAARVWLPELPAGRSDHRFRLVPVAHSGELLALLVIRRDRASDEFSDSDQSIFSEVARQLGLVLHNARLDSTLADTLDELHAQAVELRASRARVVAAADAERRRIERDLHDGAQQQLVALAVSLGVLRDLVPTDPDESLTIVDELRAEVQTAIDGVRSLAHGIYPPLLASRGLTEAISAATGRGTGGTVTFKSEGVERYSAEIEAAVYFCCLEALQNASKHATGASVEVFLVAEAGVLHFVISDHGPGFVGAVHSNGQGKVNMVDRIGAVGGSLVWRNAPGGGALVEGSVPTG